MLKPSPLPRADNGRGRHQEERNYLSPVAGSDVSEKRDEGEHCDHSGDGTPGGEIADAGGDPASQESECDAVDGRQQHETCASGHAGIVTGHAKEQNRRHERNEITSKKTEYMPHRQVIWVRRMPRQ